MTPQEAVEALKLINLKSVHPFLSWEEMIEVRDIAIQALEKRIPMMGGLVLLEEVKLWEVWLRFPVHIAIVGC